MHVTKPPLCSTLIKQLQEKRIRTVETCFICRRDAAAFTLHLLIYRSTHAKTSTGQIDGKVPQMQKKKNRNSSWCRSPSLQQYEVIRLGASSAQEK